MIMAILKDKMEIQCNGEWVTVIWVGEGAGHKRVFLEENR